MASRILALVWEMVSQSRTFTSTIGVFRSGPCAFKVYIRLGEENKDHFITNVNFHLIVNKSYL